MLEYLFIQSINNTGEGKMKLLEERHVLFDKNLKELIRSPKKEIIVSE
jgi:hypothetical protein